MYSLSSSGGQEKLRTYVSFSWLPLEAVQSILTIAIFVKNVVLRRN
jgi:hypothetical protein